MKRLLGIALIAVSLVGCSKEVKKAEVTPPTPAPGTMVDYNSFLDYSDK